MMALLFPGQGSQSVGMGLEIYKAFPTAREVFQEVDDVLNQHLSTLIFGGSLEELTLTENAQPALMTVSMAVLRVLEKEGGLKGKDKVAYMMGHSLGEYTALTASQSLSLAQSAFLLKRRGQAMQMAVPLGQGGMAALLGGDMNLAEKIAQEAAQDQVCVIANDNAPGQIVLSGHIQALERALILASEKGIKRSLLLPVSGPFHSPLMDPAAQIMQEALQEVVLHPPCTGFVANISAQEKKDPTDIKNSLVHQVTGRVRWRESILFLKEKRIHSFIEIGAGRVLSGLNKRINPEGETFSISTPQEIEEFLNKIATQKMTI